MRIPAPGDLASSAQLGLYCGTMAKPKTDEELLKRIRKEAQHILEGALNLEEVATKVFSADPDCIGLAVKRRKKPNRRRS